MNFQEGVKPMWEDERNRRGGRWVINLNKSQRAQSLDKIWLEVMLCLIGEAFDDHSKFVISRKALNPCGKTNEIGGAVDGLLI